MAVYLTSIDVLYPIIPLADLNELLDDDGDGSYDSSVFTALANMVESVFHGYVVRRYQTPLDTSDATILASAQMFCARLFEYHAYARRNAVTAEIGKRYEMTIEELKLIRDGFIGFTDPPQDEASVTVGYYNATSDDRDFTPTSLKDWGGGASRSS